MPKAEGSKKRTAAQEMRRTSLAHRVLRYAIQVLFFILAPGAFSAAFNGVKYIFSQVGMAQAIEPTTFVLLLAGVLGFTIVFGRFFCGYACAFGTLGDVLYGAFEFIRSKTPVPRISFPDPLVKALSLFKFLVLGAVCAACFLGLWQSVSGKSPWVAFGGLTALSAEGIQRSAFLVLGVLALCMIVRERFFCQFLCPLGAIFSLMPVLGFSQFTRKRDHCARKCGKCHDACPVGIWPDADSIAQGECVSCGRCADSCPMGNVNFLAIEKRVAKQERLKREQERSKGEEARKEAHEEVREKRNAGKYVRESQGAAQPKPLRKTKETWHLVRGTGAPVVVAKAILLLALFWVLGTTRYVPAFASLFGPLNLPF